MIDDYTKRYSCFSISMAKEDYNARPHVKMLNQTYAQSKESHGLQISKSLAFNCKVYLTPKV